jgi:acyl-CoA oxidase
VVPALEGEARSSKPLPWPLHDDHLTPFVPLVYVAWADGALSASEMERIRDRLRCTEELPSSARTVLESWLQPESPPSAAELARLLASIREAAGRIPAKELRSLVSLGVALARSSADDEGGWATAEGVKILEALEALLGVLGREAARELVAPVAAPPAETTPAPLPFTPGALARVMECERPEIRAKVLSLLVDPEVRVPDGLPTPEARSRVLRAVQRLADEGLGGLHFPPEFGGEGDVTASILAFETLAFGNLSVLVKFGVQFGLFGGSVLQLGTERHHREYLARIASLELPGIFAMTERDHGSNVREIETVATYLPDSEEFEIWTPDRGAVKDWLGNAALHGRTATVFAQLEVDGSEHGVHAFLVPVRASDGRPLPGVHIEDCGEKVGLNGIDNGRLSFDRVRIPRTSLLNRFGDVNAAGEYRSPITSPGRRFFTMLGTLVAGRISIAAASVSSAKTGLAIAVRYSDRRRQFGPSGGGEVPVLDYLTQQRALLPALATTYGLHFAVRDLVHQYGSMSADEERRRIEVLAAGLKAYASRHAQETLQACRESMGGRGYLAANRLGTLRADTDVFTTFEGANVVLLQLVAKGLFSEFRDEMADLRLWDAVKVLGERAGAEASRRNPVRSRRTSEDFLRDPDMQLDALRFREDRLLHTAARRLKHRIDEGMDSFDAMNECQDHLVALARAHVERIVLERFRAAVERCRTAEGPEIGTLLDTLADLYALARLEADRGWFLESGYMEGSQTRAIRAEVNTLCRAVRPWAGALVDGFGIPDDVLLAPDGLAGGPAPSAPAG